LALDVSDQRYSRGPRKAANLCQIHELVRYLRALQAGDPLGHLISLCRTIEYLSALASDLDHGVYHDFAPRVVTGPEHLIHQQRERHALVLLEECEPDRHHELNPLAI